MSHEPVMADLALRLTQQHVLSATPDAPVIEHRSRRRLPKVAQQAPERGQGRR